MSAIVILLIISGIATPLAMLVVIMLIARRRRIRIAEFESKWRKMIEEEGSR